MQFCALPGTSGELGWQGMCGASCHVKITEEHSKAEEIKVICYISRFSKAHDCVSCRSNLFMSLKRMGCGVTTLSALAAVYKCTNSVTGSAVIAATTGARQDSPTSCISFVLYVNAMVNTIDNLTVPSKWLPFMVTCIGNDG